MIELVFSRDSRMFQHMQINKHHTQLYNKTYYHISSFKKAFDRTQHPYMTKVLKTLGIKIILPYTMGYV
jgi:hypothetical protein